jgi:hypothetical protein
MNAYTRFAKVFSAIAHTFTTVAGGTAAGSRSSAFGSSFGGSSIEIAGCIRRQACPGFPSIGAAGSKGVQDSGGQQWDSRKTWAESNRLRHFDRMTS